MKQVLGKSDGALVARMPRPTIGAREILVRNRASLVSTGTETAAMQPPSDGTTAPASPDAVYLLQENRMAPPAEWSAEGGARVVAGGAHPTVETGPTAYAYGLGSPPIRLAAGTRHVLTAHVRVLDGNVSCGVMSADGKRWIATQSFPYAMPELSFNLYVDVPRGRPLDVRVMVCNHRPGEDVASSFQVLDVGHLSWARAVVPDAEPAETPRRPPKQMLKDSVKHAVRTWTGEENSKAEQALKRWYGRVTGDPIMARAALVGAGDLPNDEMGQQGWNLGYSCAGEVVEVGDEVVEFARGDLVACAGAGLANHAEYVAVPVNLAAKLPTGVDCRSGCSATVGAIALQGVRRAGLELGDRVAVIGLGLIGQLTAQLVRAAGCTVLGYDPAADRVATAARHGMHDGAATEEEIIAAVRRATGEHGVDAVIITAATKSAAPINLAMKLCRRRGCVVISGDIDIHPERADFYKKEIDLRMATSYGPGRYDASYEMEGRDYPIAYARWTANRNLQSYLELIASGHVDFLPLVDAEVPIDDAPRAYHDLLTAAERPLAVLLTYPPRDDDDEPADAAPPCRVTLGGGVPLREGPLNFVLVGAGAFGQSMLVPKLLAHPDMFQFYGVASRHGVQGENFARSVGVRHIASDIDGFLADDDVDVLVIATRHHEHMEQALAGLRAGKHVFVEKPLAISRDQLDAFLDGYEALEAPPRLLVGFNRRFSPALQQLAGAIADRRGPLMINYRINAGRIPPEHWIQGAHGGGRNIGEACHMYDVFRFLVGAPVARVTATPITAREPDLLANDNFIATVRYEDGSVATLTYCAMGPKTGLAKERIEVFGDGTAYVVDDFRSLQRAGDPAPMWSGEVDKGHAEELRRFGARLTSAQPVPITMDEIIETTSLSLAVEDLLRA